MTITNPVTDIAWAHAYWAEGSEFTALAYADGASVTSWPDEIGTANLAQVGTSAVPTYAASPSNMNGKPAVRFGSGALRKLWSASIAAPYEVAMIYRLRSTPPSHCFMMASDHNNVYPAIHWQPAGASFALAWDCNAPEVLSATYDLCPHLVMAHTTSATTPAVQHDSSTYSYSPGVITFTGVTLGADWDSPATGGKAPVDIAFWAVKLSLLTSTERSDLLAWAESHYAVGTPCGVGFKWHMGLPIPTT